MGMRPVLIIIDMQEHFRDGMAERILPQLNSLIDACRRLGVPIIFTQVWDCMRGRAGGFGVGEGVRHGGQACAYGSGLPAPQRRRFAHQPLPISHSCIARPPRPGG